METGSVKTVRQQEGVDYLTVTTKTRENSNAILSVLSQQLGKEVTESTVLRTWHFMGFDGHSHNGARWGSRGTEAIVILSGNRACEMWYPISKMRQKCTRIDLAVTVELEDPNRDIAVSAYRNIEQNTGRRSALIQNSWGGTTCYVGSRQSMYFGRLYDKGAEQKGQVGKLWRYEVECKKPASETVCTQLLIGGDPPFNITAFVFDWFQNRGILPVFTRTNGHSAIEIEARISSTERSLQWLTTYVQPTVEKLMREGYESEVRMALGLPAIRGGFMNLIDPFQGGG